jgi:YjbE family integral membrane protein
LHCIVAAGLQSRFGYRIPDHIMDWLVAHALGIAEIAWVNILLSGDNAVVIALASRSLPERQRTLGILFGAGAAIALRILFALVVTEIMGIDYLKIVGGVLLVWIAIRLAKGEEDADRDVAAHDQLWRAVLTIAIADATMSLDNVIAIAAIAGGEQWLFIFGLALSIPLIVVGSSLILNLMERYPIIVWGGAALLGWVAGEMVATDPVLAPTIGLPDSTSGEYAFAAAGALVVVAFAYFLKQRQKARAT